MSKSTLLKLASLPCIYCAIRFVAHGKTFSDTQSLAIGGAFLLVAIALVVGAWRVGRSK